MMSIGHCGGNIIKLGSLIVLQEYEVDRSSGGIQENLRNGLGFLTKIQVTDSAHYYLIVLRYQGSLLDEQSLLSENHS